MASFKMYAMAAIVLLLFSLSFSMAKGSDSKEIMCKKSVSKSFLEVKRNINAEYKSDLKVCSKLPTKSSRVLCIGEAKEKKETALINARNNRDQKLNECMKIKESRVCPAYYLPVNCNLNGRIIRASNACICEDLGGFITF